MIDSHCHLNLAPLGTNITEALQLAKQNGIERIMVPGITPESWEVLRQYTKQQYSDILPVDTAIGLHPYFLPSDIGAIPTLIKKLEEAVARAVADAKGGLRSAQGCSPTAQGCSPTAQGCQPTAQGRFCAIGETGLDGHISVDINIQKQVFHAHIALADAYDLPVILHHRKSHHLLFESLKATSFSGRGVVHAFSGSIDIAERYIERGFYLGIGGTITYERAKKTRDTVAHLLRNHTDSILLETDAPDMPMAGRQGQPNMPHYLKDVVTALADISDIEPSEIEALTSANYERLFRPKPF
ncbi:TatD family hydrolase [Alteromonas sp. BMJM2]|uniref:TatD family hydrolase n=1 Tax=Alteromonas sp. BMJM2 TaxID=2954241 RepID=UPI0022B2C309|nr:TatD family hydrolase [Alteromonas sp. BMJM2]